MPRYKRKTVSRFRYQVSIYFIILLLIGIFFRIIKVRADNVEFISPIPEGGLVITEVETNFVYLKPPTIEDEIKMVFGDKGEDAVALAKCESGLEPMAENENSSATGLFQILSYTHSIPKHRLYDPSINIAVAKQMYDEQGWRPWRDCSRKLGL